MPTVRMGQFPTRAQAEVARSALRSEGIAAEVVADDAGGAGGIPLSLRGVTLRVDVADRDQADEILGLTTGAEAVKASPGDDTDVDAAGRGKSSAMRLTAIIALAVVALGIAFNVGFALIR